MPATAKHSSSPRDQLTLKEAHPKAYRVLRRSVISQKLVTLCCSGLIGRHVKVVSTLSTAIRRPQPTMRMPMRHHAHRVGSSGHGCDLFRTFSPPVLEVTCWMPDVDPG